MDVFEVKWIRLAVIIWLCFITLLIGLAVGTSPPSVHTRTFCAYNRLFVEFEEGSHVWGTMMLDRDGRPVPCENNIDELHTTERNEREKYDKSI
jgi:hypothetical protein